MDQGAGNKVAATWYDHSSEKRQSTEAVVAASLKKAHPGLVLTFVLEANANVIAFAASGRAKCIPVSDAETGDPLPALLQRTGYRPPGRRMDDESGFISKTVLYGKFYYVWEGVEFIVYLMEGDQKFSSLKTLYILSSDEIQNNALILAAGKWANELHDQIWVFDGGYWQKNADMYRSVTKASWDAVILDPDMKQAIIDDHMSFFSSRSTYSELQVPWKRGIIYYGPPGNGKTISIKATMKMLYDLKRPVPTLYVRSLSSWAGPENSLSQIFSLARRQAPCYLVFEDLDSIVSDGVRSYFLNEVDGLGDNDGIFMVGSTNHLERLDPGISKRPSRFDRKYFFDNPTFKERVAYCHFWQSKLADNDAVEFPDQLCEAIAGITDLFSFAYIQEAFVAALLAIARDSAVSRGRVQRDSTVDTLTKKMASDWVEISENEAMREDPGLATNALWVEIQKQVKILREGLEVEE